MEATALSARGMLDGLTANMEIAIAEKDYRGMEAARESWERLLPIVEQLEDARSAKRARVTDGGVQNAEPSDPPSLEEYMDSGL